MPSCDVSAMSSVPDPVDPVNASETGMPSTTVFTSELRPPRTKRLSPSCTTPAWVAMASSVVLMARILDCSPLSITRILPESSFFSASILSS